MSNPPPALSETAAASEARPAAAPYRLTVRIAALALSFIIVILALAGIEAALRLRQYLKYGTWRGEIIALHRDPVSKLRVPAPGTLTKRVWINSLGFRSPELTNPKPSGTIRLAFLGASTTFCAEVSSNDTTWPHLVWKKLQQDRPDVRFDYLNAAISGYTTTQSISNLEYRVKPQRPDVIVIYGELTNDLTQDTRAAARSQGIVRENFRDFSPGWSITLFLITKNLALWEGQHAQARNGTLTFVPEELSAGFHARLRELVSDAQKVAPLVVLPTFSKRLRRDQSPQEQVRAAESMLYYMPFMSIDGLLSGYAEYNRITRLVAQETGSLVVEGEDSIPADGEHFADSVHFWDAGSVLMARRVSDALEASEKFRELVATKASAQ
jgi:lysophospholipase L1-like esterase